VKPDLLLLIITILVALIFDYLNGFTSRQQYCELWCRHESVPQSWLNVGRVL